VTINECSIVLHDEDLNHFVSRFAPSNNKVRGLRLELQDDKIILSGRAVQFFNISFQATLSLAHTDREIIARLERIQPMSGVMGQFKDKILGKISERGDFIQHDKLNDAIRIDVNKALQKRNASAEITIKECAVSTNDLALTFQGELLLS